MIEQIRKKKKSIFDIITILAFVVAIIFIVSCAIGTADLFSVDRGVEDASIVEPDDVVQLADGSIKYYFNVAGHGHFTNCLLFYTAHQIVYVYNDGVLAYSFDDIREVWGHTPGVSYNFVDIDEATSYVTVIVKPVYQIVANQDITFYLGNSYTMYNELITASMPKVLASFLIVILSLVLFIYYEFMSNKQFIGREMLHLSAFAFFCGVWCLNETDAISLIQGNNILKSIIPYLCLMSAPQALVMFITDYLNLENRFMSKLLVIWGNVQFLTLIVLHILGIAEFRETLPMVHIIICVTVMYMIGAIIYKIIKRQVTSRLVMCVIGLSLLLIAIIVDIKTFYTTFGDADKIGRYMFLAFVILLSWNMFKDTNAIIEKGRRARQLEHFALTDSMTGLLNRNAFETHATNETELDGVVAIVADANGLKECNDTYGHEEGDIYITTVAEVFSEVFGKYGNCYRTGGDEFCCIINNGYAVNLEKLKKNFETRIRNKNVTEDYAFEVSVAIGFAQYDQHRDKNFRELVKRADASMYENKHLYKEMKTS